MKVMTTLSTAIAFASLTLAGTDALALSSANQQAAEPSVTTVGPANPHMDPMGAGVGGTVGTNSGTDVSSGPEGASIRPTNQGAAEAGMAESTMDEDDVSDPKQARGVAKDDIHLGTQSNANASGSAAAGSSNMSGSASGTGSASGSTTGMDNGVETRSGPTGAAGNSERSGATGMSDPARTADRPGVTGASDEIMRQQRDLDREAE